MSLTLHFSCCTGSGEGEEEEKFERDAPMEGEDSGEVRAKEEGADNKQKKKPQQEKGKQDQGKDDAGMGGPLRRI